MLRPGMAVTVNVGDATSVGVIEAIHGDFAEVRWIRLFYPELNEACGWTDPAKDAPVLVNDLKEIDAVSLLAAMEED